jgi:hypothetical protein
MPPKRKGLHMIRTNWKVKTPRDKKFLKWLLNRPCELRFGRHGRCFGQMIYHHSSTGGTGLKGSDYEAISCCFGHHELFDNASKRGVGIFREGELERIIELNKRDYVAQGGVLSSPCP